MSEITVIKFMRFDSKRGKTGDVYEIEDAVREVMEADLYRDGELERMDERLDNHAQFVGELVKKLVAHNCISAADLGDLLGYKFNVEEKL